ncbi:hypothetical protein, partial [Taklimakanibacter deserti]|uniref:hypothetical protein n=1 Tax=Taklimakanibacter deserti TaxID=2267839 RepID=UPI0034D7371F
ATRYEKTDRCFAGFINIVAAFLASSDCKQALARIPAKWNHFAERIRANQYPGANPYRQSLQLWRDLL